MSMMLIPTKQSDVTVAAAISDPRSLNFDRFCRSLEIPMDPGRFLLSDSGVAHTQSGVRLS